MNRGVYFLADDGVYDLAVAFLNSFRMHNPSANLCLIPFQNNIKALQELAAQYGFCVYERNDLLQRCDALSREFHPRTVGHYRKLAIWDGPFDEFIYIDVDTVVLHKLDFVFPLLREYDFVTSHSNIPGITQWTWRPSAFQQEVLATQQLAFAANTGFIASCKHAIRISELEQMVTAALPLARHMTLSCQEQPFLNYLIVTSGKRYVSLLVLADLYSRLGFSQTFPLEFWAGIKGGIVRDGSLYRPGRREPALLVHWAGAWQPTRWDRLRFAALRRLKRQQPGPTLMRSAMPYKRLWKFYRDLSPPPLGGVSR